MPWHARCSALPRPAEGRQPIGLPAYCRASLRPPIWAAGMTDRRAKPLPTSATKAHAIEVRDLRIVLAHTAIDVVDQISFALVPGEILGLVGESGSGKTTVGLALLGHCRRGLGITGGQVLIE